jgi:uncharacterized protein YndB with AHSA1/START domain
MPDTIERTIDLNAPIERVWRAVSDHREFGTWFRVALDQPFAPGARSTGHMTYPGYENMRWAATIVAIEPPHRLAFRWVPNATDTSIDYSDWPTTLVEFVLEPVGDGTRLTVTESGFDALAPDVRDSALRSNEGGWTEQMENVRRHVEG